MTVPYGHCHCGCGEKTSIAPQTRKARGWIQGEPVKYYRGHRSGASIETLYVEEDRGYETPCWTWQFSILPGGYGKLKRYGKDLLAHRWMYEQHRGPIPDDLTIDHLCRNRDCVNPDHLEVVTIIENQRRGNGAKLDWDKVREIRRIGDSERRAVLAERYGVSKGTIGLVLRGLRWSEEEANAA